MIRISVSDLEKERRGEEERGGRGGEETGEGDKIPKNPPYAESFIPISLLNIKSDPAVKI